MESIQYVYLLLHNFQLVRTELYLLSVVLLVSVLYPNSAFSESGESSETESKTNIPNWIKQVAEFWISDQIDNEGFVQVIEYLVQQEIITIPYAESPEDESAVSIPSWIKTNSEFWVQGNIEFG